uniref:Claudin n=1 Tax=Naja naja TaxID=35670 RepID=A0A8C6XQK3_NAJNA
KANTHPHLRTERRFLDLDGAILVAALPMWQVSAFIEGHLVVAQTTWEGLWMACVVQSTGQMQCKVFDSILALSPQIQAGRTLMVIGAVLGLVALLVTVAGAQCTTCLRGAKVKDWIAGIGGALFLICGLLVFKSLGGLPSACVPMHCLVFK